MASIIKATDRNRGIHGVPFNFDDMASQAGRYLENIRAEAEKILADARQEGIAVRKRAEAQGRAAGQQAIEQSVQQQVARQMATVLPALQAAIGQIQHARQAWLTHWEKTAVHVAAVIARRVIRRELSRTPEIVLTLVREALELAAGSGEVRLHLSPDDHQALGAEVRTLVKELTPLAFATVVADGELGPGECRVETRFGVIDQSFDAQLARIEEELT